MTTKVIIAAGACTGKKVLVEVSEDDGFGDTNLVESKILGPSEFCEYFIWNKRTIDVSEIDA